MTVTDVMVGGHRPLFYNEILYYCCSDINECQENTDGCSQMCSNTIGSYVCSCYAGYRLSLDRHSCIGMSGIRLETDLSLLDFSLIDVDECIENSSGCAQICHNTIGSYTCGCNIGYSLGSNNHSCDGIIMHNA